MANFLNDKHLQRNNTAHQVHRDVSQSVSQSVTQLVSAGQIGSQISKIMKVGFSDSEQIEGKESKLKNY